MAIDGAIDETIEGEAEAREHDSQIIPDLAASDDPRAIARMMRETPVMRIGDEFTVVTRREHIESALRTPGIFSSGAEAVQLGNTRPLIPLQVDPPKHVKYRRILDPLFAPACHGGAWKTR